MASVTFAAEASHFPTVRFMIRNDPSQKPFCY
jgi:hypothetical protein